MEGYIEARNGSNICILVFDNKVQDKFISILLLSSVRVATKQKFIVYHNSQVYKKNDVKNIKFFKIDKLLFKYTFKTIAIMN